MNYFFYSCSSLSIHDTLAECLRIIALIPRSLLVTLDHSRTYFLRTSYIRPMYILRTSYLRPTFILRTSILCMSYVRPTYVSYIRPTYVSYIRPTYVSYVCPTYVLCTWPYNVILSQCPSVYTHLMCVNLNLFFLIGP